MQSENEEQAIESTDKKLEEIAVSCFKLGTIGLLEDNVNLLTDMRHVYHTSDTLQKRGCVHSVFDSNLYYENAIYRTPTMLGLVLRNHLKIKEKYCLFTKKKRVFIKKTLSAESEGFEPPNL